MAWPPLKAVGADHTARRPKQDPPWKEHDEKANKSGSRSTIYWVGKTIVGEDGLPTGGHTKGANYHGEWHGNKKNGYGVQVFPTGEKYEGNWAHGMRDGEGTLWVPIAKGNKDKLRKLYVGGFKCDKRHGRGTCFFKSGDFYQGEWDNGKMHGQGTLRYTSGDLYIGEWHDGLRSGKGTLNKANGDCYEGFWLDDKREGSGSYFYAESGKVFVGEWANDLPKAGVYTQANPNPEQAAAVPTTSVLPPVRLAMPDAVLDTALSGVQNARKAFRASTTPIARLFSEEELQALQTAFEGTQRADGTVGAAELQDLCALLGSEVSEARMQHLLAEAGLIASEVGLADLSLVLEQFLHFIAVLLDAEAGNPELTQALNGDAGGDWDELGN